MKKRYLLFAVLFLVTMIMGCKKDDDDNDDNNNPTQTTGTLIFQGTDHVPTKHISPFLKQLSHNLKVADTIKMITLGMKLTVTEIWVSQTQVVAGQPDTLTWHKIGENDSLKYIGDYSFAPVTLPAGQYKSIKMIFKNIWYRLSAYQSDTTIVVELKDNMGGTDCDNDYLMPANYFSADGNHVIDTTTNTFVVASAGEHVDGFSINAGGTTHIYWKLGGTADFNPYDCLFDWIDNDNDGIWDCGIDKADNFIVPPQVTCMWGFIVEYE